jgi:hypothetical protein
MHICFDCVFYSVVELWIRMYLSLGLHKGHPSYRSLQPSKKNIKHFKTMHFFFAFKFFCRSFLTIWLRIRIQPTKIRCGSTALVFHRYIFSGWSTSFEIAKNGEQDYSRQTRSCVWTQEMLKAQMREIVLGHFDPSL